MGISNFCLGTYTSHAFRFRLPFFRAFRFFGLSASGTERAPRRASSTDISFIRKSLLRKDLGAVSFDISHLIPRLSKPYNQYNSDRG